MTTLQEDAELRDLAILLLANSLISPEVAATAYKAVYGNGMVVSAQQAKDLSKTVDGMVAQLKARDERRENEIRIDELERLIDHAHRGRLNDTEVRATQRIDDLTELAKQ